VFFTFRGEGVGLLSVESGVYGGFIYTTTLASSPISLPPGGYSPRHPPQNRMGPFQRHGLSVSMTTKTSEQIGNRARTVLSPSTYIVNMLIAFQNN